MIETARRPMPRVITDLTIRGAVPSTFAPGDTSSAIIFPVNPYKLRLHLNNVINIASSGTSSKINFDTVDVDNVGGWNATNHQYTVPISGYWYFSMNLSWHIGIATVWFVANGFLWDVTSSVVTALGNVVNGGTDNILQTDYNVIVGDMVFMNQGDVVEFRTSQQNAAAAAIGINTGFGVTYASLHLVAR